MPEDCAPDAGIAPVYLPGLRSHDRIALQTWRPHVLPPAIAFTAAGIDPRALRDGVAVPARLLGIGLPLTIVAGAIAAAVVLPEPQKRGLGPRHGGHRQKQHN